MDYSLANPEATIEVVDGSKGRLVTFLVAPGVPETDLRGLETLYKEVIADSARSLVVNYELSVSTVFVEPNARLIVTAPGISPTRREELEKSVNDPTVDVIAVNYELAAFSIAVED
jgi:hypothetical protein